MAHFGYGALDATFRLLDIRPQLTAAPVSDRGSHGDLFRRN